MAGSENAAGDALAGGADVDRRLREAADVLDMIARRVGRRLGGHVELDDLKAHGHEAMLQIVASYDPARASFRAYADHLETSEFRDDLARLLDVARVRATAVMCAEAVPWRCHRSLIADALFVRGIRTEDIMSPTRRQVHTLAPFAKVRGTTITYPAEGSPSIQKRPRAKRTRSQPVEKTTQTQIRAGASRDPIIDSRRPGNARHRLPRRSRVPQP